MPKTKSTSDFIADARKVHGDRYDYSLVDYQGSHKKVCIICPVHGQFWQSATNHLCGLGCEKCKNEKVRELTFDGNMYLDFFLPEYNIAIECQGIQHFQPIDFFGGEKAYNELAERDKHKRFLCEQHNIKIVYYSDLKIDYPYEVVEGRSNLLSMILNGEKRNNKQLTLFD